MTQPIYTSPPLNGHSKFRLQNLPVIFNLNFITKSILAGYAVDPQKDDLILDMCAAPGGKTLHLDFLSQQQSTIVALDRSASRLETLMNATKDSTSIFPFVCDSSSCVMAKLIDIPNPKEWIFEFLKTTARGSKVKKWPRCGFDRILLDAPCSALGQRPNVCLEPSKTDLKALKAHAQKQQCLLQAAVKLLKPGGRLVYSTCTFSPFENEDNVAFVLKGFPEVSLVSFGKEWHARGVSKGWNREGFADPFLSPEEREKVLRFDLDTQIQMPDGQHVNTIGFFIAVFEKQIN
jgi:16S rRNA C967 or C1407 C5-methylase (RsmB/RsmF family)